MGKIVLLDDATINKIAAGEVIERPASVVKEVMENAIDAGATSITVEIKNGGISYIRVTDNGKGIMQDDMEIAFERHATSKLRSAEDLDEIKSMGFRGEALASIAAIAKVTLDSKTADNMNGYEVVIEGGRILSKNEKGCSNGTSITIENLFYNTPVRYKFLKKDFTEAGYIGDDVESVLSKLLQAADNDVDRAEHGIVFIDEIDKIAKKQNTNSRDVSGESVQQGLLKLLEGAEVEVPVGATSKNAMVPLTTINTRNILFICGGAFPDIEEIIKERLNKQASIGFQADLKDKYDNDENLLQKVTVEDVKKFGMIPEFIGRLPILFTLESLTVDMLVRILKEPKNAIIRQYQKLLALDEVNLVFEEDALRAIAEKAKEKKVGARALRSIIEEFMLDIMYEIPKDDNIGTVTITKAYIEGKGSPMITMRGTPALPDSPLANN